MLTLQYIPFNEIENLSSERRIAKLMAIVKKNKIILMQGRLKATEEAGLIEKTMEEVNREFKVIELCTIYPTLDEKEKINIFKSKNNFLFFMEEKKSLWDWPFENKWKTSALVLALFNLPSIRNGELSINERGIISNYYWNPPLELNIMVFMASAYYLSLFGKIKIPRIKNFFKATSIAFRGSIAYLRDNTEESIKSERTFIKYLHNPQGKLESLTEAKDLIRKGKDLDTAMEYYLEYLDAEPEKKRDFSEYFFSSVVEAIIRAKARRNNLYDLLNEAFFDLKEGNKTRLFEQDWKKILRKDSSLEIRIVYASFLSICNMPEAQETWKEIEKESL